MCDFNRNKKSKCGGDSDVRPAWLQCPPNLMQRSYPVPDGVDILPISQGGRNGAAGAKTKNKKKPFSCGTCGQEDAKPKPEPVNVKPNAPADCPMMKARNCPGVMDKLEGKGGSFFDRIKNFFGIGKEDSRLAEAKNLKVEEKQMKDQYDTFNPTLVCRKDGYFSPLFTKVDCQGQQDCTCGDEEEDDDSSEDEDEEWDDEECDEDQEDNEIVTTAGGEGGGKVENMICMCSCIEEETPSAVAGGGGGVEEEECVENKEGECILEESAECMDPECKFFFEDPDTRQRKKEDFSKVGVSPDSDCVAMNNFMVRVQAPFSDTTTNETVDQIIARLTNKKPGYPEPGPKPERQKQEDEGKVSGKEEIQLVVKQICVEEPTCECSLECRNKDVQKEEPPPPSDQCNDSPTYPKPEDCYNQPPPPPSDDESRNEPPPTPPPPSDDEPLPPEFDDKNDTPPRSEPPAVLQNDCETLSEEELLRKPIKEIKCGCPKPDCTSNSAGVCFGTENSVWIPPPPPPCARCGALTRGGTEDCYLCQLTRRMRSGLPEIPDKPPSFLDKAIVKKDPDSCIPEYLEDGSMKYKGGMCMSLSGSYIWHIAKRTPPGGYFDRFTGQCGEVARLQAITGASTYTEAYRACYNNESKRTPYRGGETLENSRRFLWGLKPIDEEEEMEKAKRVCKTAPPQAASSSAPPKDQCPAPRK